MAHEIEQQLCVAEYRRMIVVRQSEQVTNLKFSSVFSADVRPHPSA